MDFYISDTKDETFSKDTPKDRELKDERCEVDVNLKTSEDTLDNKTKEEDVSPKTLKPDESVEKEHPNLIPEIDEKCKDFVYDKVQEEVKDVSDIVENESEFEPSPEDNTERVHTYNESLDIKEKEAKLDSSVIEQTQDDSKLKDKEDIELIREETSKNYHEIDVVADDINTREISKEKEESMKIDIKEKLNESAE